MKTSRYKNKELIKIKLPGIINEDKAISYKKKVG